MLMLFLFILSQVFSPRVIAEGPEDLPHGLFFNLGYRFANFFPITQEKVKDFGANTSYIEIGYGETKDIWIGKAWLNESAFGETHFNTLQLQLFMESVSFSFIIDKVPGDFNESWAIHFNPPLVRMDRDNNETFYRVNVSISLTKPPVGEQAIQNGVIRIKQSASQQYDTFWNLWKKSIFYAVFYSILFGDISGTSSVSKYENMRYVDIIVKVKPYHKVSLDTAQYYTFTPNQVAAVPISVTNEGNYKDTIGFKIASENKKITLIDPVDITLKPGEKKDTLLGVAVPPDLFEIGTLHDITIQAYSLENPDNIIEEKTIILKTGGFYLSEYFISIIGGILLFLAIIYIYYSSKRKKSLEKYYIAPEKPWEIKEEKEYLENIKKKDKEKYEETLKQMEEEYASAILWYKDHKQFINKQLTQEKLKKQEKIKKEKKKIKEKKQSNKLEEKSEKMIEDKPKEKPKTDKIKKEKVVRSAKPLKTEKKNKNTIEKEKAIKKATLSQDKQRRKIGNKGGLEK
jgi:hypothetical protein